VTTTSAVSFRKVFFLCLFFDKGVTEEGERERENEREREYAEKTLKM